MLLRLLFLLHALPTAVAQDAILFVCGASYTDASYNCTLNPSCATAQSCPSDKNICFAVPLTGCGIPPTTAPTKTPLQVCGLDYQDAVTRCDVNATCGLGGAECALGESCFAVRPESCWTVAATVPASTGYSALEAPVGVARTSNEEAAESILRDMEIAVLAFRDHIESVFSSRCDSETLARCAKSNYNECSSTYPNSQCIGATEVIDSPCGKDGNNCNVLLDKTQTTVYLPAELADGPMDNPTDSHVIESICYSRLAEPYMIWNYNNNNAHRMYFGSSTGAFRIIPGHHSETCGQFDPRRRPWFVAASSGPKDVVLVIDVSGSMRGSRGSDLAKDAAISVVQTLSLVDRFAIITFSDEARQIGGEQGLIRATNESKTMMIEHIKNLTFIGETNFYDAFATAFDTIEQTIQDELSSNCNVAILFMTDGEISEGYPGEDDTISLVNDRIEHLATNFNRTTTIFTYSLGQYADYQVTKRLACETNGIWTPIDDFTDDLITAMSSYYKLYASGLGQGGNNDWAVWVEPYMFALGGKMGAGVSAPAYDRSVTPPLFLGVAAVDMYMEYYEEALGNNASSSELLDRFVYRSSRVLCPKIELSQCELEAMRSIGGDESRTCGTCNSTVYQANVPKKCPNQNELPSDVWNNTDLQGKNFTERACCEVIPGGHGTCAAKLMSDEESPSMSTQTLVGVTSGAAAVILAMLLFTCYLLKRRKSLEQDVPDLTDSDISAINDKVTVIATPVYLTPSAPPFNPAFSTTTEDA